MNQTELFKGGEGDHWFLRNQNVPKDNFDTYLEQFSDKTILDVGCADGRRIAHLPTGYGVDPSAQAIGTTPRLFVGTSDNLPFEDAFFDVVFFSYVLHWVGREDLLKTVAEADRVLKPGGHILINDFYPAHPWKRPYHHQEGIFTYKQDYSKIFTATECYKVEEVIAYSYHDEEDAAIVNLKKQ